MAKHCVTSITKISSNILAFYTYTHTLSTSGNCSLTVSSLDLNRFCRNRIMKKTLGAKRSIFPNQNNKH